MSAPRAAAAGARPAGASGAAAAADGSAAAAPAAGAGAEESEPDLKIILLGDSAVGKSKLVERFLMNDYVPRQMSTYALTVFRHKHKADAASGGKDAEIDFWDTAGQERFNSLHPSYYFRAHACILVFDVTRKVTYQHLQQWYDELQQYRPGLPTLVVANKIDVDLAVTKQSFKFPLKNPACHPNVYFCSASDGSNVVKVFHTAIQAAQEYKDRPDADFTEQVLETLDYFKEKEKKEQAK